MTKTDRKLSVFTHLLLGLGSGVLVHFLTHDSAASYLATGLGIGLGKDALQKLASSFSSHGINHVTEHIFNCLSDRESEPVTNLRSLFLKSFDKAMDSLQAEYFAIGSAQKYSEDADYVKAFFSELKSKHEDLLDPIQTDLLPESDLSNWLEGDSYHNRRWVFERLGISNQEAGMYARFHNFLQGRLIPAIVKSFYTELQSSDPSSIPAWIEFQRLELEALRFHLSLLSEQNQEIKALFKELTANTLRYEQLFGGLLLKVGELEESIASTRQNTERMVQALRLEELRLFCETEAWISRKYGGSNTRSPGLDEFKDGRVCVPQAVKSEVEEQLKRGEDVLLLGKPASGKTVFGLAIAMQWMQNRKTLSIYYDLANVVEASKWDQFITAKSDIDLVLGKLEGGLKDHRLLVILDNVHNDSQFCIDLLDYTEYKRQHHNLSVLCLSRQLSNEISEINNLFSNANLHISHMNTNTESFICVARRLFLKEGIEPGGYLALAPKWIKTCGGNLVVFAMAFNPLQPLDLNQNTINRIITEKYLAEAEKQSSLDKFMELCVLNSLDIDLNYNKLWKLHTVASVFPSFVRNRIVETGIRNEHGSCHLFHPSLASLCLKIQRSVHPETDQIVILKNLCRRDMSTFIEVLARLNTSQYWKPNMIRLFALSLKDESAMLLEAFLRSPFQYYRSPWFADLIHWEHLNLSEDQFKFLCDRLARTSLTHLLPFFGFIEKTALAPRLDEIKRNLLTNDDFKQKLKKAKLVGIDAFMRHIEGAGLKSEARSLLHEILSDSDFAVSIGSAAPFSVIELCNYLGTTDYRQKAVELLNTLLDSENFRKSLLRYSPQALVGMFKLLTKSSHKDIVPQLIDKICNDRDFRAHLLVSSGFETLPLLRYLGSKSPVLEIELLKFLLENEEYKQLITRSPLKTTVAFMNYVRDKGYRESVKSICVSIVSRDGISSKLLADDIGAIDKFFRLLIGLRLHEEYVNVFQSLLDSPALVERLSGEVFSITYPLLDMIAKIGKEAQLKRILNGLTDSVEFCESLFAHECTSTMIPFVRFLAKNLQSERQIYVDSIFNIVDNQLILDHAAKMRPITAANMLAAIVSTDILFPLSYEERLRETAGDLFRDLSPDPAYPKGLLITWDVQTLINKLHPLINSSRRHKANQIIAGLMQDTEVFKNWLQRQTEDGIIQLRIYATSNNLSLLKEYFNPELVTERKKRDLAIKRQAQEAQA